MRQLCLDFDHEHDIQDPTGRRNGEPPGRGGPASGHRHRSTRPRRQAALRARTGGHAPGGPQHRTRGSAPTADSGLVTAHHGRGVFVRDQAAADALRAGPLLAEAPRGDGPVAVPRRGHAPRVGSRTPTPPASGARYRRPPWPSAWTSTPTPRAWFVARTGTSPTPSPCRSASPTSLGPLPKAHRLGRTDELGSGRPVRPLRGQGPRDHLHARGSHRPDADPRGSHGLQLPDGVPVLVVLHTGIDQDRRPLR